MISAVGRVRLALNHSLNTFSLALKRRLIVAPLKLLTGRLAQVFATGFALGDGGRLNGRFVPRSRADCRSVERSAQDRRLES